VTPSGSVTYDQGQAATPLSATVTYSGGNTASMEWFSSGAASCLNEISDATGVTGAQYTPQTTTFGTTYYCAYAFDSGVPGFSSISNIVKVSVVAPPTVGASPSGHLYFDVGQSATNALSASVTYGGSNTVPVEWYSSATSTCSSASTDTLSSGSSFTPGDSVPGTTYYCAVVKDSGLPGYSSASNAIAVTVSADPTVSILPTGPVSVDVGQPTPLVLAFLDYSGANTITVEWYSSSTASCSSSSTDLGLGGGDFVPPSTSAGTTYYSAVISDAGLPGYTPASNALELAVFSDPTVAITPSAIAWYVVGQQASNLKATVTYSGPNTTPVEWYKSATPSCSGSSADTGVSGTTFAPSTSTVGTAYYCAVVSDSGVAGYSSSSNAVEVQVFTPSGALSQTVTAVNAMKLPSGTTLSLRTQLQSAITALAKGHQQEAINDLNSFISHVKSLYSNKVLTSAQESFLVAEAQAIIKAI